MLNTAVKLACCAAIIICCGIAGLEYAKKFTRREIVLGKFIAFISRIEQEVAYAYSPITKIMEEMKFSDSYPEEICEFLLDELHKDDNKDFNSCWSGAIYLWLRRYGDEAMLDGEDREVLKLLMQDALTTDAHGQEKLFRLKKSQLEERRAAAGEKRKKNQKLFRSIGFLIGVLISILIY